MAAEILFYGRSDPCYQFSNFFKGPFTLHGKVRCCAGVRQLTAHCSRCAAVADIRTLLSGDEVQGNNPRGRDPRGSRSNAGFCHTIFAHAPPGFKHILQRRLLGANTAA